ncbi:MAG TPA: toll/interleukin-1 receptor domain-containing protein, partial [Flavitalea sp.]|nr:toll/interleukin-1 receptor domain-containing protein [Flavitalea sp.]
MPYKNDVFISYKRGKISEEWLQDVFYPFFYDELNNALPFEPKIFVDKTGLTPGVDFSNELFSNLIFSKCLVSIWSPPYFRRSEWCLKEFLTMRYKQEYYQLSALTMPKTLVWPIMYRTVQPLPVAVKSISYLDYSDYNFVGPVKQSPLIIDLQK